MATAEHGEYGAFTGKGGTVRYLKNKKMIAKDAVPPEVVALLDKQLVPEAPTRPQLTEEMKAKLRAESLQVKPELQAAPEKLAEDAAALTEEDFPVEELPAIEEALEKDEIIGAEIVDKGWTGSPVEVPDPDFLETVSIHSAPLESIVQALYERFGIYTVHLNQLPKADEINPLTGEQFSNYHLGIAYQAAIRAQNQGILTRKPEEGRRLMEEGRKASAEFQVDPVPRTMGEARRANSFDYRTSVQGNETTAASEIVHITDEDGVVHAVQRPIPKGQTGEFNGAGSRYDEREDEILVEPQMGKKVIRPDW